MQSGVGFLPPTHHIPGPPSSKLAGACLLFSAADAAGAVRVLGGLLAGGVMAWELPFASII